MIRLNLGSGEHNKEGYINIDHRFEPNGDMMGDVFKLSEFEDNSVDELRAWHLLEHASHGRTLKILKVWYTKLKPGGFLQLSVPDMEITLKRAKKYLENPEWKYEDWVYFNERFFGLENRSTKQYGEGELKEFPGIEKYELALHKCMLDPRSLKALLEITGFKNVERIPTMHKEVGMKGYK